MRVKISARFVCVGNGRLSSLSNMREGLQEAFFIFVVLRTSVPRPPRGGCPGEGPVREGHPGGRPPGGAADEGVK